MNLNEGSGAVAAGLTVLSCIPYTVAIFRRTTVPNRASWWIWGVTGILTAVTFQAAGGGSAIYVAYVFAGYCAFVAILSIWYGEGGFSAIDLACIGAALATLVPWVIFNNAPGSLYLNILIDSFAIVPTLLKAYHDPGHEDLPSWALSSLAMVVNLGAVQIWTLAAAIYPLYAVAAVGSVTAILLLRRHIRDAAIS